MKNRAAKRRKIREYGYFRKKKRRKKNRRVVCRTVCFGLFLVFCLAFFVKYIFAKMEAQETMVQESVAVVTDAPVNTAAAVAAEQTPQPAKDPEESVYTFLQGPKSWGQRLQWSGEWGVTFYDGGSFGGFGCGLCCIANVYSSLTEYQCTPVNAYFYAKKHTGYGGGGAIAWGYMRKTLTSLGFSCQVEKKPSSYRAFQEKIAQNQCAIVLVSSADSTCYWKDTPGHYVTIFLYNQKKDKVFLADSGDPEHNRQWISLRKIYRSLKTSSAWQYLTVGEYEKKQDNWKHKRAKGNWVRG